MTTGRINQVANPLFVASWQDPRRGPYQPAAELQRSAVPWRGGRTWTVSSARDEGAWVLSLPGNGGLSVVVLGTRGPFAHPWGVRIVASLLGSELPFGSAWTRPRPGEDGPSDALGIEFPAGGVRSVDNYVRPSR